jgi:hypothetical protein
MATDEHWNARIIREQAEAKRRDRQDDFEDIRDRQLEYQATIAAEVSRYSGVSYETAFANLRAATEHDRRIIEAERARWQAALERFATDRSLIDEHPMCDDGSACPHGNFDPSVCRPCIAQQITRIVRKGEPDGD